MIIIAAVALITSNGYGQGRSINTVPIATAVNRYTYFLGLDDSSSTWTNAKRYNAMMLAETIWSSIDSNALADSMQVWRANPYQYYTATSYTTSVTINSQDGRLIEFNITAQGGALLFNAPTGVINDGQVCMINIMDNGTAQALTWNTSSGGFEAAVGSTLPTTTTMNRLMMFEFKWSTINSSWNFVGQAGPF